MRKLKRFNSKINKQTLFVSAKAKLLFLIGWLAESDSDRASRSIVPKLCTVSNQRWNSECRLINRWESLRPIIANPRNITFHISSNWLRCSVTFKYGKNLSNSVCGKQWYWNDRDIVSITRKTSFSLFLVFKYSYFFLTA